MEHTKMIRIAGGLDTFLKISQRIIVIAIAVMLVAVITLTIATTINPNLVIGAGFNILDTGGYTIHMSEGYTPDNGQILSNLWAMSAVGALSGAGIWYAFKQIRRMLASVRNGQPFCETVCDALHRLSKCVFAMGIISNVGKEVSNVISLNLFPVERLLENGGVAYFTVNHELDLSFLVAFFFLRLMVFIFRYGMQLQQLSDETL